VRRRRRRSATRPLACSLRPSEGFIPSSAKRERVKRDYLDGKLRADLYGEALATLDTDCEQAEARAAELREAAASVEALAADIDVEHEILARLERIQSVIRGSRADIEAVEEIRRALRENVARIEYEEGGSFVLAFGSREMAAKWRERKPNLEMPAAQAADAGSSINDPR
jgi:DNA repair ATPase RecN